MATRSKSQTRRVPKEVRRLDIPHVRMGDKEKIEIYARLTVTRKETTLLGPGKVRLLELINETGSIATSAKLLGMSYRRAWLLIQSMTEGWKDSPVKTVVGGLSGGGTVLTPLGRDLVRAYREMEREIHRALTVAAKRLRRLTSE